MNMPGFTAEATLHRRNKWYCQKAGDVDASSKGILPAQRIPITRHSNARAYCRQIGGIYWSEGPNTATYGCVSDDGEHGIVCGGVTGKDMSTCDRW